MKANIKNSMRIEISEKDPIIEGGNDKYLNLIMPIGFEDASIDSYIRDAKRIIDAESKHLNPIGLRRLLAAMIIELEGNDYNGKFN